MLSEDHHPTSQAPADEDELLCSDLFKEKISERVVMSRGELLLMVIKYAVSSNLTFTGLSNLIKMVNCVFSEPVLPESRYMITQALRTAENHLTFHFYYMHCFYYLGLLDNCSEFTCPHCKQMCKVSSLSEVPFFVTLDLHSQLQKISKSGVFLDLPQPLPSMTLFRHYRWGVSPFFCGRYCSLWA